MSNFDTEMINRLIASRRSVYTNLFSGDEVNDQIIQQMLENANWAPTHRKTEPWRFQVFTRLGLKKLADFQADLYRSVATKDGTFQESKLKNLSTKPLECSHVISIAMRRDEKESVPEIEEIESVACAVQNMALTATAYGVGCYWGSGGITYMDEAKKFFNLSAKDRLLGFLYVGVPRIEIKNMDRIPISQKTNWIRE